MARALNSRVRGAHQELKARERYSESENRAGELDARLSPLELEPDDSDKTVAQILESRHPSLREPADDENAISYRIIEDSLDETNEQPFFSTALADGRLTLVINPDHPFYRKVYKPLVEEKSAGTVKLRGQLELLLLAAARSEALASAEEREVLRSHRSEWSRAVATFLNG
jgi:hypothetical protein